MGQALYSALPVLAVLLCLYSASVSSAEASATPPPSARFTMASGLIALLCAPVIADYFLSIFAQVVARHFGLDKAGLGRLFSAGAWGGLAGAAAFLLFSRRPAGIGVFRTCMGIGGACSIMAAVAPRPACLMVGVAGVCGSLVVADIVASALLPSLISGSPRRILAAKYACLSLVGIAAPFAGGLLMAWSASRGGAAPMNVLRSVYFFAGVAMLGGAMLFGRRAIHAVIPAAAPSRQGWTVCIVPAILAALHGGTDSALARWAPTFYGESFADVLFPPAWILSGYAMAYFCGRLLLSILPEGRAERLLLFVPGLAGGCLLMAGLACRSFGGSAALYVGASLMYGLEFPVLMGLVARRMPTHLGRTIALGTLLTYALYGGLSVLIGELAQATGSLRNALLICPFGFVAFGVLAAEWSKDKPVASS